MYCSTDIIAKGLGNKNVRDKHAIVFDVWHTVRAPAHSTPAFGDGKAATAQRKTSVWCRRDNDGGASRIDVGHFGAQIFHCGAERHHDAAVHDSGTASSKAKGLSSASH